MPILEKVHFVIACMGSLDMVKENTFAHLGRIFAVRAAVQKENDNEFIVRVYEGDLPATPILYTLTFEAIDAEIARIDMRLLDGLMRLAESDVKDGIAPVFPPIVR